jgi:hypothetical protein
MRYICVDFDGVIADYTHAPKGWGIFGHPIDGARQALVKFKQEGHVIIIYTCRNEINLIKEYLRVYKIPYDYINESPLNNENSSHKPIADVYIDDRAVRFNGNWKDIDIEQEVWYAGDR